MTKLLIAGLVAMAVFAGLRPAPEANAAMDYRQVIVNMLDGMNRMDIKAVMSYYADDAESRGSASCDCKGKAGIEKDNLETFEIEAKFTVVSIRETQTGMGIARVEMRSPIFADCAGVSRSVITAQIFVANEKIVREVVDFDRTDPQTLRVLACIRDDGGMAPRMTPPRTGDGPEG
jgi:hypothetical protein